MNINIAVDARPLSMHITGIGRYLQQLLLEIIPLSKGKIQWFLYSDLEINFPNKFENLSIRSRQPSITFKSEALQGILSTLSSQLLFPYWCQRDNINIFWGTRHQLPIALPKKLLKVLTIHDLVWKIYPDTMSRKGVIAEQLLMPLAIKNANRIICISESTQNLVRKFYPNYALKTKVVYNGNKNNRVIHSSPPISSPYFLFVGTLEPRKNLPRVLEAFSTAKKDINFGHKLVIIGAKGWGKQNIETIVQQLNIARDTVITGYIEDTELQRYYQHAEALLLPSLYEGFGLPILEAYQYGVPVITSNCYAMPEVAGKGGILVDPHSTESISRAICEIQSNTRLRGQLSKHAVLQSNKFNWRKTAETTLSIILSSYTHNSVS